MRLSVAAMVAAFWNEMVKDKGGMLVISTSTLRREGIHARVRLAGGMGCVSRCEGLVNHYCPYGAGSFSRNNSTAVRKGIRERRRWMSSLCCIVSASQPRRRQGIAPRAAMG